MQSFEDSWRERYGHDPPPMHFDRDGKPITHQEWLDLWACGRDGTESEYRRIGLTETEHGTVSTVWLGMDHGFGRGRPVIFETMIYEDKGDHGDFMDEQWRYCTELEALAGHDRIVEALKNGRLKELDE